MRLFRARTHSCGREATKDPHGRMHIRFDEIRLWMDDIPKRNLPDGKPDVKNLEDYTTIRGHFNTIPDISEKIESPGDSVAKGTAACGSGSAGSTERMLSEEGMAAVHLAAGQASPTSHGQGEDASPHALLAEVLEHTEDLVVNEHAPPPVGVGHGKERSGPHVQADELVDPRGDQLDDPQ